MLLSFPREFEGKVSGDHLIFLPNTVSAVVLSVVWLQYIFNSSFGFLTTVFHKIGIDTLANIQWTDDQHLFISMLVAYSFGSIGYFMVILNAGIDRIPHDFYEAALLEGATAIQKFFLITLPLLRDVFRTTLVLWTITAINFFVWSATFGSNMSRTSTMSSASRPSRHSSSAALDPVEEEEEEPDNAFLSDSERLQSADPLKLYVRQIGDGRLLTPVEERELRAARTSATRLPSGASSSATSVSSCRSPATTRRPACRSWI